MSENGLTVVDIGTSKVLAVYATPTEDGGIAVRGLVQLDGRGVKKGAIVDLDDVARTVDSALRKLSQEMGGQDVGPIVLTISGSQLEGSSVQGFKPIIPKNRAITNQDVMEVVQHSRSGLFPPNRVQVQSIPREFRVDETRNIQRPIGLTGAKLEVMTYIVTGVQNHVQMFERSLSLTDRSLSQFVYGPLASGIGVLNAKEIDQGSLVVDMGASKTDIGVFLHGSLAFGACLPAGGNNVTSDLSQLLNTGPDEAERLKLQHGCATSGQLSEREAIEVRQLGQPIARPMQRKVLCEIIESRMGEIAKIVHQQVEKSGYLESIRTVVLTGGASHMERTKELFEKFFPGVVVRISEPKLKGGKDEIGLAAAIGAAHFVLQTNDDLEPISGSDSWQDRVRGLWSMFSTKS